MACLLTYMKPGDSDSNKGEVTVTDTIANKKEEVKKDSTSIKKEPKELAKDSVVNKKQKSKEKEKKKKVEEKTPKPVAPKDTAKNNRPIG